MIDSVLKGTGNSRFLKSAVPSGTSWADALAMLQAGTFPIDFNGINTDGFQQVGTPLNKANLLKDATAAQIGLPPSTTPDGMFQALGNTGELHVWRKTVVTAAEIPAGYTLGSAEANVVIAEINNGYGNYEVTITYGTSVHVSDAGIASSSGTTSFNTLGILTWGDGSNRVNTLRGKFCKVSSGQGTVESRLFYVPNNATLTYKTVGVNNQLILSSLQPVNPYPLTPAGTTTTYPVSTNRNAYQEGNDAKPAGYTLGEVVTGTFQPLSYGSSITVYYASSVTVSDSGVLQDIPSTNYASIRLNNTPPTELKGKFIQIYSGDRENTNPPFNDGKIYYIPSNAVFATNTIDRYQPVTGYAAIPAGTTIEYLGKLGDKARVQVVSYVGTGTYGKNNPNMLQLPFEPKYVIVQCLSDYGLAFFAQGCTETLSLATSSGTKSITCSWPDTKTLKWYQTNDSYRQLNASGVKYVAIIIG